jgi:dTDP-4-dehydrorhamnose 3,5-epimerase
MMKFIETKIPGAYVVDIDYTEDARGFFARTWDETTCAKEGLSPSRMVQSSTSYNHTRGTLRGMHYQTEPFLEAKVVRCVRGSIYDVVLDLRKDSPTYTQWYAVELSAKNRTALYVPPGCAHGMQVLSDETEVLYMMSEYFHPEAGRGVRYNDPVFNIEWPLSPTLISEQDKSWPDWKKV